MKSTIVTWSHDDFLHSCKHSHTPHFTHLLSFNSATENYLGVEQLKWLFYILSWAYIVQTFCADYYYWFFWMKIYLGQEPFLSEHKCYNNGILMECQGRLMYCFNYIFFVCVFVFHEISPKSNKHKYKN